MRGIATVLMLVAVLTTCCAAASFVQKREKKGPSLATLKENCCQSFGDVLKQVPACLNSISVVQAHAVDAIQGQWQGDSSSFCAQASRQKLETCTKRLQAVHEKMEALLQEFESCVCELQK